MKYKIYIDLYKQPKICTNISHVINVMDDNDKYNPFSSINKYAHMSTSIDDSIYDKIVDLIVFHDLVINDLTKSINKSNALTEVMFPFLKDEMSKNNICFEKSSKYSMQSSFVKVKFNTNGKDVLLLF